MTFALCYAVGSVAVALVAGAWFGGLRRLDQADADQNHDGEDDG